MENNLRPTRYSFVKTKGEADEPTPEGGGSFRREVVRSEAEKRREEARNCWFVFGFGFGIVSVLFVSLLLVPAAIRAQGNVPSSILALLSSSFVCVPICACAVARSEKEDEDSDDVVCGSEEVTWCKHVEDRIGDDEFSSGGKEGIS
jgi:hypothetical protein